MSLSKKQIFQFQTRIWNYYKKHRRLMPWRGERDPYKVLVSEIMLQQTQVSRVLPKYKEFLKKFPTLKVLEKAPLSEVLKTWQGLGYNRRAKFLHQFAKEVVVKHKGRIPQGYDELLALPGIGKGTAGSLSAFAFDFPVTFIETNIRRVYIHHFFHDKKDVSDGDVLKLVEITLPVQKSRPTRINGLGKARPTSYGVNEWYYALMDYGAYLKTKVTNPNRKSKHYTKQSKFVGSNREMRGAIVKYLSNLSTGSGQSLKEIERSLGFGKKRFGTALAELIKEGFVTKKRNIVSLI